MEGFCLNDDNVLETCQKFSGENESIFLKVMGKGCLFYETVTFGESTIYVFDSSIGQMSLAESAEASSLAASLALSSVTLLEDIDDLDEVEYALSKGKQINVPVFGRIAYIESVEIIVEFLNVSNIEKKFFNEILMLLQVVYKVDFVIISPIKLNSSQNKNNKIIFLDHESEVYSFYTGNFGFKVTSPHTQFPHLVKKLSDVPILEYFGLYEDEYEEDDSYNDSLEEDLEEAETIIDDLMTTQLFRETLQVICSDLSKDCSLSLRSKGLFQILLAHDFDLTISKLAKLANESKEQVFDLLGELKNGGYIDFKKRGRGVKYSFDDNRFKSALDRLMKAVIQ